MASDRRRWETGRRGAGGMGIKPSFLLGRLLGRDEDGVDKGVVDEEDRFSDRRN